LDVSILILFFLDLDIAFYGEIIDCEILFSQENIEDLVFFNFGANVIFIIYMITLTLLSKFSKKKYKEREYSSVLKILEIKPYLLWIHILNLNFASFSNSKFFILILSFANIVIEVGYLLLLQKATITYRFEVRNFLRRKHNTMIPWLLIIPIVISLRFYGELYAGIFIIIRSLSQIYFNMISL
jgi:hypothetical protein